MGVSGLRPLEAWDESSPSPFFPLPAADMVSKEGRSLSTDVLERLPRTDLFLEVGRRVDDDGVRSVSGSGKGVVEEPIFDFPPP